MVAISRMMQGLPTLDVLSNLIWITALARGLTAHNALASDWRALENVHFEPLHSFQFEKEQEMLKKSTKGFTLLPRLDSTSISSDVWNVINGTAVFV